MTINLVAVKIRKQNDIGLDKVEIKTYTYLKQVKSHALTPYQKQHHQNQKHHPRLCHRKPPVHLQTLRPDPRRD